MNEISQIQFEMNVDLRKKKDKDEQKLRNKLTEQSKKFGKKKK